MNNITLAYTAGIVDGEGCIGIYRRIQKKRYITYVLVVTIANTNPQLMEFLYPQFGGSFSKKHRSKPWKSVYHWTVEAKSAGKFLKSIFPYLLLKKPQAELALRFQAKRRYSGKKGRTVEERALEEANYTLMKSYNKRG